MEIYGFIPIIKGSLGNQESNINIIEDRLFIEGTQTRINNQFKCVITAKCIVNDKVPQGDIDSEVPANLTFEKTVSISTGVIIEVHANSLDIKTITPFELVNLNGTKVTINSLNSTIVNLFSEEVKYEKIDTAIEQIINVLNSLPTLQLDSNSFSISDGKVVKEDITNDITGVSSGTREVWRGSYPLDKLLNAIRGNLDILHANQLLKDDQYAGIYTELLSQAMQYAVDLEKHRITTISTMVLGALKPLTDIKLTQIQIDNTKNTSKLQCRVYYAQYKGFKSNNINKLFGTQIDGASSAFSSGMLESAPPIFNMSSVMELYSKVANAMVDS